MTRRCRAIILAALLIALAAPGAGGAAEIKIAQLYGLPYLPMHVVVERQLIAARARAAGLDVTVTPVQLSGGPTANDLLLSGKHEVKTHAAIEPFATIELADPRARVIHASTEELGGAHVAVVLFTGERWKTEHAAEFAVLAAAFREAIEFINAAPRAAAEIYIKREASPLTVDQVAALIGQRDRLHFTPVPHKTLRIAQFMHKAGTLKSAPDDWKDLFWETVHDLPGS